MFLIRIFFTQSFIELRNLNDQISKFFLFLLLQLFLLSYILYNNF